MVNFSAETGQIIPATSGIIGTCRRTETLLCLNSKVITPNSHDLSILYHHVSQFFSNQKTYFLWSACPSLVPACVSQRRTASLDPRLLSAHSLGGPKEVKDMRLPIPTDHGLWMIPSYKWPTNGGWKPPLKDWILVGINLNDWSWRFCELCIEWKTWKHGFSCNYWFFYFHQIVAHVDCVGELHNIIHIAFCGCFVAFNIIYSDRGNLCSILHLNFHSRLFPRSDKKQRLRQRWGAKDLEWLLIHVLGVTPKDSPIIKPPREKREPKPDSSRLDMTWCWSLSHGWASFQTSLFAPQQFPAQQRLQLRCGECDDSVMRPANQPGMCSQQLSCSRLTQIWKTHHL